MRKTMIKFLSIACMFLFTFGFLALGGCSCNEEKFELYGLEPKEEITVTQGDFVLLESFHIFDNKDNYYEVKGKVVDGENNEVAIVSKGFFASKVTQYKIIYTVISVDGIYTKETIVNVEKNLGTKSLNVYVPETGEVGEPIVIEIDGADEERYAFFIAVTFDGATETVENKTFTPTQSGDHTVTVTATETGKTPIVENYTVQVAPAMIEGTIETFDESWTNKRGDWYVTDTEETGIKNRYGDDGSYLAVETADQWLRFYVNPKKDKNYYQTLAENGYEYVSVWVYLDSNLAHVVQHFNGYSNYYAQSNNIQPKTWQEIRITLQDDPKNDFNGSFLTGFNYFASGAQNLLTFDNSDEYNGGNGGRERDENGAFVSYKVYVDDIYAVKKGDTIELDEALQPQIITGDTYDLKQFLASDNAQTLQYKLTYRGETYTVQNGVFTFTQSGEYTLSVGYATQNPNLYGSKKTTLTVGSPYTSQYQPLIQEKTGDMLAVELSQLAVTLKDGAGADVDNVTLSYSATKNGKQVAVDGSVLTATEIGCYDVEVKATYIYNGTECSSYVNTVIDVWDTANKYNVFTYDGSTAYFADSFYMNKSWEKKPTTSVVDGFDGQTGSILKVSMPNQQRGLISATPTYSKYYYEEMLKNDISVQNFGQLFVSFSYQIVDETGSNGTRKAWVFHDTATTTTVTCGQWYTIKMTLADYLEKYYSLMKGGFDYLNGYRGGAEITINNNKGYALFALANNSQLKTTCYFSEGKVFVQEFTGKYVDLTQKDRLFSWDYSWQRLTYNKVFSVQNLTEETALLGKTGEMLVYNGTQQKMGLQYIPAYSKEYYEYILSKYPNAYVSVWVYADIAQDGTPVQDVYTKVRISGLGTTDSEGKQIRKWHEIKVSLADIVANFDAMQISALNNKDRKDLITVDNIHYNSGKKDLTLYFSGFDFVLGDEATTE